MKTRPRNIAIILCLLSTILSAKVLYVDQQIGDGFWANSYKELGLALKEAKAGDEIWVAKGKYLPGRDKEDSFVVKEGLKLYGGFYGGETKLSDRDLKASHTILSGALGIESDESDNILHVILCCQTERERPLIGDRERVESDGSRETSGLEREKSDVSRETKDFEIERTVIDGFTIRDGNARNGNGGGGILCESETPPLIRNCRFINNQSKADGGAIHSLSGIEIESCLFNNNHAQYGGAIYIAEGKSHDTNIIKSTFVGNSALDGAVIFNEANDEVKLDFCVMLNNHNSHGDLNSLCSNGIMKNNYMVSNTATDDQSLYRSQNIQNITYVQQNGQEGYFLHKKPVRMQSENGIPSDYGFNLNQRFRLINTTLLNNKTF